MRWNKSFLSGSNEITCRCILFSAILFIAAVGFSAVKIQNASYIKSSYTSVSIRFKSEGATENDLAGALKNEKNTGSQDIPAVTAWSQLGEEEIKNQDLCRKVKVPVKLVAGDMSLTAPMTLRYGNYACQDDRKGCVIDTDTAYTLYGTENAVGNRLTYKNSNYYVRGVVSTNNPLLILSAGNASITYPMLEFVYHNKEQGQALTEEFLLRNNFPENYTVIDGYFYGRMYSMITSIPIWLFYLFLSIWLLNYLWRKRQGIKPDRLIAFTTKKQACQFILFYIIGLLILLGFGAILMQFTGTPLYIPEKLIPSKFSDFEFWTRQYKAFRQQLNQMRYLVPNQKDILLEHEITGLPLGDAIMLLLFSTFLLQIRTYRTNQVNLRKLNSMEDRKRL